MPLCRFAQTARVARRRRHDERVLRLLDQEVVVRTVCSFIAATVPSKGARRLIDQASTIELVRRPGEQVEALPSFEAIAGMLR